MSVFRWVLILLWFLFNPRINLSPFTKDFRGEEHCNEYSTNFSMPCKRRVISKIILINNYD